MQSFCIFVFWRNFEEIFAENYIFWMTTPIAPIMGQAYSTDHHHKFSTISEQNLSQLKIKTELHEQHLFFPSLLWLSAGKWSRLIDFPTWNFPSKTSSINNAEKHFPDITTMGKCFSYLAVAFNFHCSKQDLAVSENWLSIISQHLTVPE